MEEETKEEKIELKSITADGESPPATKVRSAANRHSLCSDGMNSSGFWGNETPLPCLIKALLLLLPFLSDQRGWLSAQWKRRKEPISHNRSTRYISSSSYPSVSLSNPWFDKEELQLLMHVKPNCGGRYAEQVWDRMMCLPVFAQVWTWSFAVPILISHIWFGSLWSSVFPNIWKYTNLWIWKYTYDFVFSLFFQYSVVRGDSQQILMKGKMLNAFLHFFLTKKDCVTY